ncbi:MAG TPA: PLP-dependent cysteine synthase family protein [Acidobacteriaceae bacterium]|nr:PLP-dependent cysteine synthase family protein [Acidobacteriaceae bacterium]
MPTSSNACEIPRSSRSLIEAVGNTPLLAITFSYRKSVRTLYAKAEHLNLTGSIKDRMALYILLQAYRDGSLHPGDTIMEATSGNTGIAFAAIGRAMGHPVVIYMPDWMSRERVQLIEGYGARVVPVSREDGGFLGSIRMTQQEMERRSDVYLPCQFANRSNCEAHASSTGPELLEQLNLRGLTPDAFVAGVGTGGTIMGISKFLRSRSARTRIYPVEPAESPTLSTGYKVGTHRIQGISDEFIPSILQLDTLDEVLPVSDGDSILMAQKLASTLGLGVGISSGCNFLAAVMAQEKLPAGSVVATIFCDDNKKYLSTDLFRQEPVRDSYLSPEIELLEFRVF